jgi:DNA-binding MarR family transcriptional regulator
VKGVYMDERTNLINELIVDIYNDIMKIEGEAFRTGQFKDVSITEVHTIEAIGMLELKSMSEVARTLRITVGTLTVATNNLVKKGYAQRYRSESDRRVVKLGLTKKGRLIFRMHSKFHAELVKSMTQILTDDEIDILEKALSSLNVFLKNKYFSEKSE